MKKTILALILISIMTPHMASAESEFLNFNVKRSRLLDISAHNETKSGICGEGILREGSEDGDQPGWTPVGFVKTSFLKDSLIAKCQITPNFNHVRLEFNPQTMMAQLRLAVGTKSSREDRCRTTAQTVASDETVIETLSGPQLYVVPFSKNSCEGYTSIKAGVDIIGKSDSIKEFSLVCKVEAVKLSFSNGGQVKSTVRCTSESDPISLRVQFEQWNCRQTPCHLPLQQ